MKTKMEMIKIQTYNENTEITLVWCIGMHSLLFFLIHFKQDNLMNYISTFVKHQLSVNYYYYYIFGYLHTKKSK